MLGVRTPFRCSLFGSSCDYPNFFEKFSGLNIGFALKQYSYLFCRELPAIFKDYNYRLQYSQVEMVREIGEIQHNGIRGVLQDLDTTRRYDILHASDLPSRTGIGSSSSFVVGLINLLTNLEGVQLSKRELAYKAIRVEREVLAEPGGWQDQIFASYGGVISIEYYKAGEGQNFAPWEVKPLPVSDEFLSDFRKSLVMLYTGSCRNSFEIAKAHGNQTDIKHCFMEIAREAYEAFENGQIEKIGKLLRKSWEEKRKISQIVSSPVVDSLYDRALTCGCWGAKLLGAGGNGFLLCVIPPEIRERFIREMGVQNVDVDFDLQGSTVFQCH